VDRIPQIPSAMVCKHDQFAASEIAGVQIPDRCGKIRGLAKHGDDKPMAFHLVSHLI
jgi:hypothetical protein